MISIQVKLTAILATGSMALFSVIGVVERVDRINRGRLTINTRRSINSSCDLSAIPVDLRMRATPKKQK